MDLHNDQHNNEVQRLLEKIEALSLRQNSFAKEIDQLKIELQQLKNFGQITSTDQKITLTPIKQVEKEVIHVARPTPPIQQVVQPKKQITTPKIIDLEKFIGENLVSKIGILIILIGVIVGAKYSIDNGLISPLTRIVLGYLMGVGLLVTGIKLKEKYLNYSAVLVSGAIAIMYLITFLAYSLYDLFPQPLTFALMVVFTVFTIVAALHYNQQVIALIGFVGAYAVPFLLSNGSGNVSILFSYMAIINAGILVVAFKTYWKWLYYASFVFTWLIFAVWYTESTSQHFAIALGFSTLFFISFYLTFLAYKLIQKEQFVKRDVVLLLSNAFIFYAIGYNIIGSNSATENLLGLFTVGNAVIHFFVSVLIYKQKLADRNLFYLMVGLVVVFITIAVPVQLEGNWVTLLWLFEAVLLFAIGRIKQVAMYEKLSYPLMILAFIGLIVDWSANYHSYIVDYPHTRLTPVLNIQFLCSMLFVSGFAYLTYLHQKVKPVSIESNRKLITNLYEVMNYCIPAIFLIVLFFSFRLEITNYWSQLFIDSELLLTDDKADITRYFSDGDLLKFQLVWAVLYSLSFFSLLAFVNNKWIQNRLLAIISLGFLSFFILLFLTESLYCFSELRHTYINQTDVEYYERGVYHILIRYIAYGFIALTFASVFSLLKQVYFRPIHPFLKKGYELLLYLAIIWVASSELLSWLEIMGYSQSYKLVLSILWGVYSLLLIVVGIVKKKKHIRIAAFALFSVTLIKLFFYDIASLSTIAKTIAFVTLGVLLLLISFLYNKYKHIIEENESAEFLKNENE